MTRSTARQRRSLWRECCASRGQVFRCLTRQDLFAPAIVQAGLAPDREIYVEAGDETSVLVCFEEGLRRGGLGTVVSEVVRLSMTASRCLQLAAGWLGHHRHRHPPLAAAGRGGRFRPADSIHLPLADHRPPRNSLAGAWRWTPPMAARIDPVPRWGKCRLVIGDLFNWQKSPVILGRLEAC